MAAEVRWATFIFAVQLEKYINPSMVVETTAHRTTNRVARGKGFFPRLTWEEKLTGSRSVAVRRRAMQRLS
jgi:hypothetical protein